jgi:hypothetical protein
MIRNTAGTILLAATVTAVALTQATHVRAAGKFDGTWSVAVYTRSGPCDAAYRFSGQIVNGVIVYNGGLGPIDFSGRVRPNGAASLRVASGSAICGAPVAPALGTGKRQAGVAPATGLRSGAELSGTAPPARNAKTVGQNGRAKRSRKTGRAGSVEFETSSRLQEPAGGLTLCWAVYPLSKAFVRTEMYVFQTGRG